MDTRFWGPSGWRLLHSIVSGYNHNTSSKQKYLHFFENLPDILPCIYCRRSLTKYYQEFPIQPSDLNDNLSFHYWLYRIHNLVNDKLRGQGLLNVSDPTFSEVVTKFKGSESDTCLQGWDFLYSIAMNYPAQSDLITENKRQVYRIFFDTLPNLIPNLKLANQIFNYRRILPLSKFLKDRDHLVKWLYGLESQVMQDCPCFHTRCNSVEKYRAGCKGVNDTRPTCRRIKSK
jgi:hypothetical protein